MRDCSLCTSRNKPGTLLSTISVGAPSATASCDCDRSNYGQVAGLQQGDKQLCAHLLDAARMVVAQYFAFSVCDHLLYRFAIGKQQSAVNAAKAHCAAA